MSYNKGGSSSSMDGAPQGDTRLFVTKIPRNCTEQELTAHFGNFGELKDVHMPRVPGHGGHKGIAFVSYSDPECAAAVREMGGHIIHGQPLIVDHATQRAAGAHRKYLPGGSNFHESSWNPHGHNSVYAGHKGGHSHGGHHGGGWGSSHYNDWGASSSGKGWGDSHSHSHSHSHHKGGNGWGETHGSSSGSWWESVLGDGGSTRAGNSDAGSDNSTTLHPTNSHLSCSSDNSSGNANKHTGGDDFWDSLCSSFWGESSHQGGQSQSQGHQGKKGSPLLKGSTTSSSLSCSSSNNPFEELSGGPAKGSSRESASFSPPQPLNTANGAPGTAKGSPHLFVNEADKIFVTKIGSTITRENLVNYFTQFGELIDVYMPPNCDQTNGLVHKGIAFVSFRDVKTAEHVLKRSQYEIKPGKFIVVDRAKTRRSTGSIGPEDHLGVVPQTCAAQATATAAQTEAPAARIAPY